MKFTLEIELGNEAMRTYEEVFDAIRLWGRSNSSQLAVVGDGRPIRDGNGNTVGGWSVVDDSKAINLPF